MPDSHLLLAFVAATLVFAFMPGPAMLYAAAQTVARGRRAGWFAALGIHIGCYVHVIAATLGLSALFEAVPTLYLALKLAGAAYLVWLGVRMFLDRSPAVTTSAEIAERRPLAAFRQSVLVEVLNPKTAIFFLAFLPQFTDPAAALPIWAQLLVLGTFVNLMFTSADVVCVLLADRVARYLRASRSAGRIAQRIGGSILVGLGLNVALNRQ